MTSSITLPPVAKIPSLSAEERAGLLDLLFERCTQLHTLSVSTLKDKNFADYGELVEAVRAQLNELHQSDLKSDEEWLEAILAAHPRLGEKKVESAMSKQEQSGLQGPGQEEETEKLRALNAKYEEAFPGLRYVCFVNGRPRPVIMEDMQRRIDSSNIDKEKDDSINAMCEIALDRAKKLGADVGANSTTSMTPGSFQPS